MTFKDIETLRPQRAHTKRVGRPKQKWVEEVMRRAWDAIKYDYSSYDPYNRRQASTIRTFATRYYPPVNIEKVVKDRNRISFVGNEAAGRARMNRS